MLKLSFYVAADSVEQVKQAIFAKGAGQYDKFKNCCWQSLGQGQYQVDEPGSELVDIPEYKVEVYVREEVIDEVLAAFNEAHPCDEPAFDLTEVSTSSAFA